MARKTIDRKVFARVFERLPLTGPLNASDDLTDGIPERIGNEPAIVGAGPCCAPCGDYEITEASNQRLCFSHCDGAGAFHLSIDAVMQHVCEGRIRINDGHPLPLSLAGAKG